MSAIDLYIRDMCHLNDNDFKRALDNYYGNEDLQDEYEDEWDELIGDEEEESEDIMDYPEDRVHLHPNELEEVGYSNPEDALNELIDLKHGFQEND
jgi:hypothetical protein